MSRSAAQAASGLDAARGRMVGCRRCPRLVASREAAAAAAPARYAGQRYWAKPVPGFGDPAATVCVLGLATAAHGGNRTGRALTGNASAGFLMAALHRTGFANQPTSERHGDGLRLTGSWLASAVRCPPPDDRPTAAERDLCGEHLEAELAALPSLRVIVALGGFAWTAVLHRYDRPPRPRFGHLAEHRLPNGLILLASYHPSSQNTATRRLTKAMLDTALQRARQLAAR